MNLEDVESGSVIAELTFAEIDPCSMKVVTAMFRDPNPIHFDEDHVTEAGFPGRVNPGPLNASYAAQTALSAAPDPGDLRALDVRYRNFVFEGETVTATATVDKFRETDCETVLDLNLVLRKEDGTTALTGTATVVVDDSSTEPASSKS